MKMLKSKQKSFIKKRHLKFSLVLFGGRSCSTQAFRWTIALSPRLFEGLPSIVPANGKHLPEAESVQNTH